MKVLVERVLSGRKSLEWSKLSVLLRLDFHRTQFGQRASAVHFLRPVPPRRNACEVAKRRALKAPCGVETTGMAGCYSGLPSVGHIQYY